MGNSLQTGEGPFYCETQVLPQAGCMHAVNACLGGPSYDMSSFSRMEAEYRRIQPPVTLLSFALWFAGSKLSAFPIPLDSIAESTDIERAFVYSSSHTWVAQYEGGRWYRIDSALGVSAECPFGGATGAECIVSRPTQLC